MTEKKLVKAEKKSEVISVLSDSELDSVGGGFQFVNVVAGNAFNYASNNTVVNSSWFRIG